MGNCRTARQFYPTPPLPHGRPKRSGPAAADSAGTVRSRGGDPFAGMEVVMNRHRTLLLVAALSLPAGFSTTPPLLAADATVGTGSAASCTEAALDAALATVNAGGGTLDFACGPAPHTIVVASAKAITADVIVEGGGRITLSGGLGSRILTTASATMVTLQGLVLTHGFASGAPGGAIYVQGAATVGETRLTLLETTVRDSVAGTWGGGIAASHATLTLLRSALLDNTAGGGGGGLNLNQGSLAIESTRISGNLAAGDGGGIEMWTGELFMLNSVVDGNETQAAGDVGRGGALALRDISLGSIDASRIAGNRAEAGGGGLFAWGDSTLYIVGSEIRDNSVPTGVGGGLLLESGTEVAGDRVLFARNVAVQGGAVENNLGLLRLGNATMAENTAVGGTGGAISNSGDLDLIHVTIARNLAAIGGGIWSTDIAAPQTHLRNVLFSANSATTASPDCHFLFGPSSLVFSLWPGTSCGSSSANGNQPNTTVALPRLALTCAVPLGDVTLTLTPPAGSAAVDTASCDLIAFPTDARGVERPQGLACDIGAVEVAPLASCDGIFIDGFETGATVRWDSTAS